MRAFTCPVCRHLVSFDSTHCLHCRTQLGFDWNPRTFVDAGRRAVCANRELLACNGVALAGGLCRSCALTRTRPADGDRAGLAHWSAAEAYRTGLGHMRPEIGHYYRPILAPEGSPAIGRCRELVGDERQDYSE